MASAPDFPVDERTDRGFANWFRSLGQVRRGCWYCRQHQCIASEAKLVLMAEPAQEPALIRFFDRKV